VREGGGNYFLVSYWNDDEEVGGVGRVVGGVRGRVNVLEGDGRKGKEGGEEEESEGGNSGSGSRLGTVDNEKVGFDQSKPGGVRGVVCRKGSTVSEDWEYKTQKILKAVRICAELSDHVYSLVELLGNKNGGMKRGMNTIFQSLLNCNVSHGHGKDDEEVSGYIPLWLINDYLFPHDDKLFRVDKFDLKNLIMKLNSMIKWG
jgi:hypothetical protein